jgi:hypothetical protein
MWYVEKVPLPQLVPFLCMKSTKSCDKPVSFSLLWKFSVAREKERSQTIIISVMLSLCETFLVTQSWLKGHKNRYVLLMMMTKEFLVLSRKKHNNNKGNLTNFHLNIYFGFHSNNK